jgi:Fe-S-cluster-containing hydrogenase component 2
MKDKIRIWHENPELLKSVFEQQSLDIEVDRVPVQPIAHRAYTTFVIPDFCSDCIYCEGSCPNLRFDKVNKIMIVNSVACRGCGLCLASCPTGALQQRNPYLGQINDRISGLLDGTEPDVPQSCNMCPVVSGEAPEPKGDLDNIRLTCTGRFEVGLLLDTLSKGYKGLLVVGCLFKGFPFARNKVAIDERMGLTKGLMDLMGLDIKVVQKLDSEITNGGVKECLQRLIEA